MHPLLIAVGKIAAPLVLKKVEKEISKKIINEGLESEVKTIEVAYEGMDKKKSAAWVVVAVVGITFASSQGWIAPELAQALIDLVQNEAVQDAVNEATSGE
jgi:hypothetical protein